MPQNHDPNTRANPIDAANLAIARLHNERNQMLVLIADMRQFLTHDYPEEYRPTLIERIDALLERR